MSDRVAAALVEAGSGTDRRDRDGGAGRLDEDICAGAVRDGRVGVGVVGAERDGGIGVDTAGAVRDGRVGVDAAGAVGGDGIGADAAGAVRDGRVGIGAAGAFDGEGRPGLGGAGHTPAGAGEQVDLRLLPAVLAAWATAAGAVVLGARAATVAGCVVLALGAAALAVPAVRSARGTGSGLLAVGAVGLLLLALGAQLASRDGGQLRTLAEDGARVRLTGVVRSTPRAVGVTTDPVDEPSASPPRAVRLLLAAQSVEVLGGAGDGVRAVRAVRDTGGPVATGAAVEVVAPGSAADLAYGATVEIEATLAPARDPAGRAVVRARALADVAERDPPGAALRAADRLRTGLRDTAAGVPGDAGRLLPGVVVGDTRDLGGLTDAMRASGLAHLTAVSGLHFSLVGGVAVALARRCAVPRRWRCLPVGAVMLGFVLLVQPGASVVRAAVMGGVGLLGLVAGRPARSVPALACAVVALLVVDPWLARDIGFVLSVVATAGITLLAGPLTRRWRAPVGSGRPGARDVLAAALAVPVAAQLVCAPVLLVLRPEVPLYGVLANLVVAPAVGPATLGGLAAALLGPWWPAAATATAHVAGAACWWIAAVARTAAGLPGARVGWVAGAPGAVLLAVAGAAVLVLVLRRGRDVAP